MLTELISPEAWPCDERYLSGAHRWEGGQTGFKARTSTNHIHELEQNPPWLQVRAPITTRHTCRTPELGEMGLDKYSALKKDSSARGKLRGRTPERRGKKLLGDLRLSLTGEVILKLELGEYL